MSKVIKSVVCVCCGKITDKPKTAKIVNRFGGAVVKRLEVCGRDCRDYVESQSNPVPTIDDYNELVRAA